VCVPVKHSLRSIAEKVKRFAIPFRWCNIGGTVKLFIVHHHFRPGGVRRIIELAAPQLAATLNPRVDETVLVADEAPDAVWLRQFKTQLAPVSITCRLESSLSYLAEQRLPPGSIARRLRRFLEALLRGVRPGEGMVWAHNQSLGRNLLLTRELALACAARQVPLVLHHHDWWFDNRWMR
jgi:hypothetical protein